MTYNKLKTLSEIFARKHDPRVPQEKIHVSFDEVREQILRQGDTPPKSIYNFFVDLTRSGKSRSTPSNAEAFGYIVVRAKNGGEFVRRDTAERVGPVPVPDAVAESAIDAEGIPALVRRFLRSDEGGLFSAVEYVHLLDRHFGLSPGTVQRVQVPVKVQPNEIDGLFVFSRGRETVLLPVEAKSKSRDSILFEQVYGAAEKAAELYAGERLVLLPMAAKIDDDASILIVEFSPRTDREPYPDVRRFARYRLDPVPALWQAR